MFRTLSVGLKPNFKVRSFEEETNLIALTTATSGKLSCVHCQIWIVASHVHLAVDRVDFKWLNSYPTIT